MSQTEPTGLLRDLLKGTAFGGVGLTPQFMEREIVIELTQDQLKQMLLEKADERAKSSVTLELKEGKMILKIRLW